MDIQSTPLQVCHQPLMQAQSRSATSSFIGTCNKSKKKNETQKVETKTQAHTMVGVL